MNEFIKTQQELVYKSIPHEPGIIESCPQGALDAYKQGWIDCRREIKDTLIQQIITNTGEELMRRVEGGRRKLPPGAKEIMGELGVAEEKLRNFGFNKAVDTSKQHITAITNVE